METLGDAVDRLSSAGYRDAFRLEPAGLRALIYAKQKVGSEGDIYIIGAPEGVLETLEMTGFAPSVIIQETYDMSSQ